ncbi:methyltransferase domain-containing protein [Flavobacteriaceae bacterium F89]|uniref:Methyltransferase domain-containing protein n=1 Tax=Cerina litoralis TaxID=2874477 RepID=A0AAE3JPS4_9FLAO|nr:methyltransferase domain-containing protein [Cerina litoralis]MCG2459448.1 methyltransferase domain-containing protein [Cerina litoralis]
MLLNKKFWEDRYAAGELGWDMGEVSPPLKDFIDQLNDKNLKILVPGAGNGHEVVYLYTQGFKNVFVIDIAHRPLQNIKLKLPNIPEEQLVEADFFDLAINDFDLVLEQTFFCALDPRLREDYVIKMHHILKPKGRLVGLLFDFPLSVDGPPFGGNKSEYQKLFSPYFKIDILESSTNSIKPRQDRELFFIFEPI